MLLNYQITPQPLNAGSKDVELQIEVSAIEQNVYIKSIELDFLKEQQTQSAMGIIFSSSNKAADLIALDGRIQLIPPESLSVELGVNSGTVTVNFTEDFELVKGQSFSLQLRISKIVNVVGESAVIIKETAGTMSSNTQLSQSSLILKKFPQGFSLSHFKAENNQVYSGEPIVLSWQAVLDEASHVILHLKSLTDGVVLDVTDSMDSTGNYKHVISNTLESGSMDFELMAILTNGQNQAILIQSYALSRPITILPPKIIQFDFASDQGLVDNKVPISAKVTLSWQIEGKVDYYLLDIGGGIQKKLPGDAVFYEDTPVHSTTYKLSAYVEKYQAAVAVTKPIKVPLCYPPYRPESIAKIDGLVAVQVSHDGSVLYAATEDTIHIINTQTNVTSTVPVSDGLVAIVLSHNNAMLYIAHKRTPLVSIVATKNPSNLMPAIVLSAIPQALCLTSDDTQLYVGAPRMISIVNTSNHKVQSVNLVTQFERVSAMILSPDEKKLFLASTDNNTIIVFNTKQHTEIIPPISINVASKNGAQYQLRPRSLAIAPDASALFIALAGNDTVVKIPIDKEHSASTLNVICRNPESLLLVTASNNLEQLYVTTGFNNSVSILSGDMAGAPTDVLVGSNPYYLAINHDATRLYVVCSKGIYSFWTKVIDIAEVPISRPSVKRKDGTAVPSGGGNQVMNLSHASDLLAQSVLAKQQAMIDQNRLRDQQLESSRFGFFFPDLRKPGYDLTAQQSLQPFGVFFESENPEGALAQPVISPQKKNDVALSSQPNLTENTAQNHSQSSFGLLKDLLATEFLAIGNRPILELQSDSKTFTLAVPKKFSESNPTYSKRVGKLMTVIQSTPALSNLSVSEIHLDKMSVIHMISKNPNQGDVNVLKRTLTELTGLPCKIPANEDESLFARSHIGKK